VALLYAAACHFGWAEDVCAASTHSLMLNLYDPVHRPSLLHLHMAELLALYSLHHERRMKFCARIVEAPFLTDSQLSDTTSSTLLTLPRSDIVLRVVRVVAYAAAELKLHPAGDTVLSGLDEWLTALACWSAKCKKVSCSVKSGVPPESITDCGWCVAASTGNVEGMDDIEVVSLEVGTLDESSLAISTLQSLIQRHAPHRHMRYVRVNKGKCISSHIVSNLLIRTDANGHDNIRII